MSIKINEIKKLELKDNDIIVLKGNYTTKEIEEFRQLVDDVLKLRNILILCVSKDYDIGTLPEKEMNKLGWFRKDSL